MIAHRMIKKPTLGRGLADLLGQSTSRPAPALVPGAAPAPAPGDELAKLPLDLLQRGKYQPRIDMRPETLQELADSIKAQGVVQPIVVRPLGDDAQGRRYEIIAGERRWRSCCSRRRASQSASCWLEGWTGPPGRRQQSSPSRFRD